MTREDLVRLARNAVSGTNRPAYCDNPASFDPHEWVLDAMKAAYHFGRAEARIEDLERSNGMAADDLRTIAIGSPSAPQPKATSKKAKS